MTRDRIKAAARITRKRLVRTTLVTRVLTLLSKDAQTNERWMTPSEAGPPTPDRSETSGDSDDSDDLDDDCSVDSM